jgi:hypothetical protein
MSLQNGARAIALGRIVPLMTVLWRVINPIAPGAGSMFLSSALTGMEPQNRTKPLYCRAFF